MLDAQIPSQGSNHGNPATVHHPTPVTLKTYTNTYHKGAEGGSNDPQRSANTQEQAIDDPQRSARSYKAHGAPANPRATPHNI